MNARVPAFALAAAMTASPARAADTVSLFAAGSLRAALTDVGRAFRSATMLSPDVQRILENHGFAAPNLPQ
jgi:ABC-type molybdate transport system substrate-binding protein